MKAILLKLHPDNPEKRKIQIIVETLKNDGVIIYPTDSVYNFGCSINSKKALEKIAKLRGDKVSKTNYSIVCKDIKQISEYTAQYSRKVFKVLNKNLPGAFTFILEANKTIAKLFEKSKHEVGVRIPNNIIVKEILNELGEPIITTSIHKEGIDNEYYINPDIMFEHFHSNVDLVIDGGLGNNIPSTIVNCIDEDFEIIREGIGEFVI